MPAFPLTGGCLCGGVRYEIDAAPVSASYCHCTRCQRRTGTAASAQARVAPGSFRVVAGRGARRRVGAGRPRLAEVLLLGLRRRALEPQPDRRRRRQRPARDVRRRPRDPAAVAAVRRLRGRVGADSRRRPAPLRRASARADAAGAFARRPRSAAGLRERINELESERDLLNAIANYAPSLICLVDDQGRVRPYATNQAFERTLGYEPHETGGALFWERYVPDGERPRRGTASRRQSGGRRAPSTKGAGCSATGPSSKSPGRARRCRGSRAGPSSSSAAPT